MIYKGQAIQRGNPERKWDVKRGWITTEKLRGEYNAICAFAVQQIGRFSSINISPEEGGLASCTLSIDGADPSDPPKTADPTSGEPEKDSETWELKGNDLTKDIWSHKRIKNLTAANYTWLRQNTKLAKENGTWAAIDAAIVDVELKKMFRLFMDGVESYSVAQYVIARQITTSGAALGSFATKGANIQYTTAQLITEFRVPNGIRFTLPQGAWIQRTPSVTFDGSKWANQVEWWHADEWNEVLYPKYNTPEATELPPITLPPSQQVNPPVITTQPIGASVSAGTAFDLTCAATGDLPIQYAWFKDGAMLSLGATLSIASAEAGTHDGDFTCRVTNPGGFVTSDPANIFVEA